MRTRSPVPNAVPSMPAAVLTAVVVSVFAALLAPAAAAAAPSPVVLLPATGANVDEGTLAAATDVLRSQLERTGAFAVALSPGPGGVRPEPSPAEAAAAARAGGAGLAVTLRVARLGNVGNARLAAYRADGSTWHTDELPISGTDDLEPALRRLARGLAEGRPARALAEIDTVTQREADPLLRRTANRSFGVRLGAAFPFDRAGGGEDGRAISGLGVSWLYDARSFLADVSIDWYRGHGDSLFQVGLGGYYPLSADTVSPYVGGGLAWSAVDTGGGGSSGLGLRLAAGVLVGRTSNVQLRVEGGWQVSLFAERSPTGEAIAPQFPYLCAGVGF